MRLLCKTGPHAGRVIDYPLHVARRMLEAGVAERVPFDARATDIERAVEPTPETPEAPALDLESMSKADLVALAEKREIEVRRADGKDGSPLKSDYVRALG